MDLAIQFRKRGVQLFPLLLHSRCVRSVGYAHPRIDLVFDSVVIGWTKKQLAHVRTLNRWMVKALKRQTELYGFSRLPRESASSRRNGSTSVIMPIDCSGCCSTTRSTAEASMSTQTIFTVGASMLTTASECRMLANSNACVTSASFSRIIF